jgi:hypothetical protein
VRSPPGIGFDGARIHRARSAVHPRVAAVGLGPFAGVLGIALHTWGSTAKLWAEAIENISPGPLEAAAATGASRVKVLAFALLPDVAAGMASVGLFWWDFNVRASTVLGVVGAGGLGQELKNSMDLLLFPRVLTIIVLILVTVTVSDGRAEVIRATGLAKRYPPAVDALAGVSRAVACGEFVALLGPSGAGKTTLFRRLTGLTAPDAGTVDGGGHALTDGPGRALRAARREIAPTWRVLARRFSRADRDLALRGLDTVGLRDEADVRADQLSGGQQQRVATARSR